MGSYFVLSFSSLWQTLPQNLLSTDPHTRRQKFDSAAEHPQHHWGACPNWWILLWRFLLKCIFTVQAEESRGSFALYLFKSEEEIVDCPKSKEQVSRQYHSSCTVVDLLYRRRMAEDWPLCVFLFQAICSKWWQKRQWVVVSPAFIWEIAFCVFHQQNAVWLWFADQCMRNVLCSRNEVEISCWSRGFCVENHFCVLKSWYCSSLLVNILKKVPLYSSLPNGSDQCVRCSVIKERFQQNVWPVLFTSTVFLNKKDTPGQHERGILSVLNLTERGRKKRLVLRALLKQKSLRLVWGRKITKGCLQAWVRRLLPTRIYMCPSSDFSRYFSCVPVKYLHLHWLSWTEWGQTLHSGPSVASLPCLQQAEPHNKATHQQEPLWTCHLWRRKWRNYKRDLDQRKPMQYSLQTVFAAF